MRVSKTFQTNGEPHITRADNVLDLKVRELGLESKLLNNSRILASGQLGVVLRLCSRHNHLARSKDQCSRLWLTDTHDHSSKTLIEAMLTRLDLFDAKTNSTPLVCTFGLYSALRA